MKENNMNKELELRISPADLLSLRSYNSETKISRYFLRSPNNIKALNLMIMKSFEMGFSRYEKISNASYKNLEIVKEYLNKLTNDDTPFNFKIQERWRDDLQRCPSQCYLIIKEGSQYYCIYIRWRHADPWECYFIPLDYKSQRIDKAKSWINIFIGSYDERRLTTVKLEAMNQISNYLGHGQITTL